MKSISRRCCFTGHRPEKLNVSEEEVKKRLKIAISRAIEDGFNVFISGMARGIDMWAAEIVLEERCLNDEIKLVCVSPYKGVHTPWNYRERERYINILDNADVTKFVCEQYSSRCYHVRNCYMVDHSTRVIAAYNGEKGGTKNTVNYAKSKGIEVINVLEM